MINSSVPLHMRGSCSGMINITSTDVAGGAHYVPNLLGDASILQILLAFSPDPCPGLINFSSCTYVAVIHYVAEKVPTDCALWRPRNDTSTSNGKAKCRPPNPHVKDHALIPAPPADPVHTITLQSWNIFSIHRHGIVPPNKHRVASQVCHGIPAWLAPGIIPQNNYFILGYTAVTASWQLQSDRAACISPDLVQVTVTEHQVLGTSKNGHRVVWRGKTGSRIER